MMKFTFGNILNDQSEAVVNPVNCVGVMGRGLALQFKKAYPANFKAYASACQRGDLFPGRMFVTETGEFAPRYVINFPTKRNWRDSSRIEDIQIGLEALVAFIRNAKIQSIAIPPLGAGLSGLPWSEVRNHIVSQLTSCDGVNVTIYEPIDATGLISHSEASTQGPA